MGIFDDVAVLDRATRKLRIAGEATTFGALCLEVKEEASHSEFRLSASGAQYLYAEGYQMGQMLEGLLMDVGEHHVMLSCPCPAPAAFVVDRNQWWSNDAQLAGALQGTEPRLSLCGKDWKWYRKGSAAGRTYYPAQWAAQVRPAGTGTHLAMRGLQGDVFTPSRVVGAELFLQLVYAVHQTLSAAPQGGETQFLFPTSWGQRIGDYSGAPVGTASPPAELGPAVAEALKPLAGKVITHAPLDEKRAKLLPQATPPWAARFPVLAVLGEVPTLGKTQLLVVTPTHGLLNYDGARCTFAWSDVQSVAQPKRKLDEIFVQTKKLGWVPLPHCENAPDVANALRAALAA